MSRPHLALALFVLLITVPPACGQPAARPMPPAPAEVAWRTGPLVVFSAGGAGGDNTVAEALSMMRDRSGVPLTVQSVAWCRMGGPGQNVSDHSAQLAAAAKVADSVRRLRARWPDANVVLVGYSAGTRVVLAAAEALPAGSVDRIILPGGGCLVRLRPEAGAARIAWRDRLVLLRDRSGAKPCGELVGHLRRPENGDSRPRRFPVSVCQE